MALIGAKSGKVFSGLVTVSYAIPFTPVFISFFANEGFPAKCKYVKSVTSELRYPTSDSIGSLTFTINSDFP